MKATGIDKALVEVRAEMKKEGELIAKVVECGLLPKPKNALSPRGGIGDESERSIREPTGHRGV